MNIEHGPEFEQWSREKLIRALKDQDALIRDLIKDLRWRNEYAPSMDTEELLDRAKTLGYES